MPASSLHLLNFHVRTWVATSYFCYSKRTQLVLRAVVVVANDKTAICSERSCRGFCCVEPIRSLHAIPCRRALKKQRLLHGLAKFPVRPASCRDGNHCALFGFIFFRPNNFRIVSFSNRTNNDSNSLQLGTTTYYFSLRVLVVVDLVPETANIDFVNNYAAFPKLGHTTAIERYNQRSRRKRPGSY